MWGDAARCSEVAYLEHEGRVLASTARPQHHRSPLLPKLRRGGCLGRRLGRAIGRSREIEGVGGGAGEVGWWAAVATETEGDRGRLHLLAPVQSQLTILITATDDEGRAKRRSGEMQRRCSGDGSGGRTCRT